MIIISLILSFTAGLSIGYVIGKWVSPLLKKRALILIYDDEETAKKFFNKIKEG